MTSAAEFEADKDQVIKLRTLVDKLNHIAGVGLEELRRYFTDNEPLGGVIPPDRVQHRAGDIALDGFWSEDGTPRGRGGCDGLAFITISRIYRTDSGNFPAELEGSSTCGSLKAVTVQIGVARCAAIGDDAGNPPSSSALGREAIENLDDGARIDNAMCRMMKRLERTEVAAAYAMGTGAPEGPMGGIISWTQTASIMLA